MMTPEERGTMIAMLARGGDPRVGPGIARAWANHFAAHPPAPVDVGHATFEGLLTEAQSIADRWSYPERVHLCVESTNNWVLRLSTGGWSENEEIVDNVSTMFRMVCWVGSRRGGHYVFGRGEIADAVWERLVPLCPHTIAHGAHRCILQLGHDGLCEPELA